VIDNLALDDLLLHVSESSLELLEFILHWVESVKWVFELFLVPPANVSIDVEVLNNLRFFNQKVEFCKDFNDLLEVCAF